MLQNALEFPKVQWKLVAALMKDMDTEPEMGSSPLPSAQCSSCGLAGSPCAGTQPEHQLNWYAVCQPPNGRGTARSLYGHGCWLSHGAQRPAGSPADGMPGAAPLPDGAVHAHEPTLPRNVEENDIDTDFTIQTHL